jgi:hypothetical protein
VVLSFWLYHQIPLCLPLLTQCTTCCTHLVILDLIRLIILMKEYKLLSSSLCSFLHLFIHQWLYSLFLGPGLFFSYVIFFTQAAGLLARVISPSQGRYLHTGKQTQNKRTHRHPCLEWDSNPRSQRSSERS